MKKKFLAIFLSIGMILALLPASVPAEELAAGTAGENGTSVEVPAAAQAAASETAETAAGTAGENGTSAEVPAAGASVSLFCVNFSDTEYHGLTGGSYTIDYPGCTWEGRCTKRTAHYLQDGYHVTLEAFPNSGYYFLGWYRGIGDYSQGEPTYYGEPLTTDTVFSFDAPPDAEFSDICAVFGKMRDTGTLRVWTGDVAGNADAGSPSGGKAAIQYTPTEPDEDHHESKDGTAFLDDDTVDYYAGEEVTLIARPDPGHYFVGWFPANTNWPADGQKKYKGQALSTQTSYTFQPSAANSGVCAVFQDASIPNLHVTTAGNGSFVVDGTASGSDVEGCWIAGTPVSVSAVPDAGFRFAGWQIRTEDGRIRKEQAANITLAAGQDVEAVAKFGLEKAFLEITPPVAGESSETPPQITFPEGAGYGLDDRYGGTWWTSVRELLPNPRRYIGTFEAGETYYAIVRVRERAASFAEKGDNCDFDTMVEVTGGTVEQQAVWKRGTTDPQTGERTEYLYVMALIAVTIPGEPSGTGYKDIETDNTVDESTTVVKGTVHIEGSGGTQAGYGTEKTVYEERVSVPYSDPETAEVLALEKAGSDLVRDIAKDIWQRGRGESGGIPTKRTTTERTWDDRRETMQYSVTDGPGITHPIAVVPVEGKADTYADPSGRQYTPSRYEITRERVKSGRYGRETVFQWSADGRVEGFSITVSADPAAGGTASAGLAKSLAGETVALTAKASRGFFFMHWNLVSEQGSSRIYPAATSFTMPGADVLITASFAEEAVQICYDAGAGTGGREIQNVPVGDAEFSVVPFDSFSAFKAPAGKHFAGWEGSDGTKVTAEQIAAGYKMPVPTGEGGSSPAYTFTAYYEADIVTLCTGRSDGGLLQLVTPGGEKGDARMTNTSMESGSNVTLTAIPEKDYVFAGFYKGIRETDPGKEGCGYVTDYDPEALLSDEPVYSFTMWENTDVYALFKNAPSTLTLHWSSVDGEDVMPPVQIPFEDGTTLGEAIQSYGSRIFGKEGYNRYGGIYTKQPLRTYAGWDELFDAQIEHAYPLEGDTALYCIMLKEITDIDAVLTPPVCGTPVSEPPQVEADPAGKYSLTEAEWRTEEEVLRGGEVYDATILFAADYGYLFELENWNIDGAEADTVWQNGETLAIDVRAEVKHVPKDAVIENRVEPTCADGSYDEVVYCKGCGEELSRVTKKIPATGEHTWDAGVVTTEPTCTTPGVKTFTCTVCGATTTEEIPALGHTWGEWTQTKAPTCTEPGEETRTCERCKEKEKRSVDAPRHSWDAGVVTTEPGCTTEGVKTFTCIVCGGTKTEKIPALGHAWGEWIIDKEATEDADGLRHRECSRCDAVEEEVIPMIVASYDIVEGDGATWYTGSKDALTFTFKRSVNDEKTFELFQRIEIDGKEVAPANYTAKAGSVIITLKPEYIKTLAVGKHMLTAFFEDGKKAEATFTIAEKKADVVPGGDSDKKGSTPSTDKDTAKKKAAPGVQTGDNANSVLYMGLGIAALLIIAVTLILLKRRSRHEQ